MWKFDIIDDFIVNVGNKKTETINLIFFSCSDRFCGVNLAFLPSSFQNFVGARRVLSMPWSFVFLTRSMPHFLRLLSPLSHNLFEKLCQSPQPHR